MKVITIETITITNSVDPEGTQANGKAVANHTITQVKTKRVLTASIKIAETVKSTQVMTSEALIGLSTRDELKTMNSLRSIPHRAPVKVDTTLLISTVRGPKTIEIDVIEDILKVQQQSTRVKAQVHAHMVVET